MGKAAGDLTLADLNGDGKVDLATPHFPSNTVTVLLNRGDGRFASRSTYRTAKGPQQLEAADLNGDGKADLVSANSTSVSVLLNRGDGTFQAARDYVTPKDAADITVYDLNGDRKLDLVTRSHVASTVSVFINVGDGTFAPRRDYATGTRPGPVAIADVDGNGSPDMATANDVSTVSLLLNQGDGTYERHDYATGKVSGDPTDIVELADLNGDGQPDIVTANDDDHANSSSLSVLLNRGAGVFGPRHDYSTTADGDYVPELADTAIRDLNGDRQPDLVLYPRIYGPMVEVFLNQGGGAFGARRVYRFGNGFLFAVLAFADVNGDQRPDLVSDNLGIDSSNLGFDVRLSRSDGSFDSERFYRVPDGTRASSLADLNGDGRPEMIIVGVTGVGTPGPRCDSRGPRVSVFLNNRGRFRPRVDYRTCGSDAVAVADVDGNGKPDLVTSDVQDSAPSFVAALPGKPGFCSVQDVEFLFKLAQARERIVRGGCRVGKVRYVHRWKEWKGYVIDQKPGFGAVLQRGGKVTLVVNLGKT